MKIKGHTEIQLFDRDGNMVQNTHDDNMITNGLAGFLKNHGMLNDTPFSSDVSSDLITTLLGGILLFNETLTESANTTMMPDGVKMTANGAYGITYSGTPTELGSYDANETGWQNATTFRFVYNWNNAQGNGVIKSAALTSRAHGYVGEGNSTSDGSVTNNNYNELTFGNEKNIGIAPNGTVYAIKNNVAYAIVIDTDQQDITIKSRSVNDTACDIRNIADIEDMTWTTVATLSNPSANVSLVAYNGISVRYITGAIVMAIRSNDGILVLNLATDYSVINSYAELTAAATSLTFNSNDMFFLTEDGDYIITYNYTASKVYKIEVANPTNVVEVTVNGSPTFGSQTRERYSIGKRHYFSNAVYDETLGQIYINNLSANNYENLYVKAGDVYKDDNTLIAMMSGYSGVSRVYRNNGYLATVNNLANAVTKDSSQTMKVIYSLTFA